MEYESILGFIVMLIIGGSFLYLNIIQRLFAQRKAHKQFMENPTAQIVLTDSQTTQIAKELHVSEEQLPKSLPQKDVNWILDLSESNPTVPAELPDFENYIPKANLWK